MRPARKVVVLVAGAVVGAGAGLLVAERFGWASGSGAVLGAAVATGLCLPAAVATLLLAETVFERAPLLGPAAVLLGTGMRMTVAVVGAFLFGGVVAAHGVPHGQFANWVAYLYIVTLALECGLLATGRQQPGAPR